MTVNMLFNHPPTLRSCAFICLCLFSLLGFSEQTWTVNSKQMDVEQLIISVAKATNKTIIIDPKVKGKVQVVSSKPLNKQQYYELFLSILEVHGFVAVESGEVVRVVPQKDARTSPVRVVDDAGLGNSEVVTQVIQLENISAAKLIPVLRPLAPQQAHMAAYTGSNAIIISDTSANIARIRRVIEKIDHSALEKTEIVPLQHAAAEDVVKMLEKLQKNEQTKGQAQTNRLLLVADKRTNSLLVNGDELERQRIRALIKHIDSPLAQSGNVKVVYLEYADAGEMAKVLSKVVQNIEDMSGASDKPRANNKSSSATVEADKGTNSLVITADADVMQSLLAVVAKLDIRRAQVLVEAIIVEIEDTNDRNLGVEWLFLNDNGAYGSSTDAGLAGRVVGGALPAEGSDSNDLDTGGIASALAGTAGQVLGYASLNDGLKFNVVLNALQANSKANILSTPSLLTLDNEEASIVVARKVPFTTGSYTSTGSGGSAPENPFQTVERQDVGITLKVTPQINEGDSMVLTISQEASDIIPTAGLVNGNIVTSERTIETTVLVDDGEAIVLGGLIGDKVNETIQKVPVLGSIPYLGALFRSTSTNYTKQHLMVFLRATIVRDKKDMSAATGAKYRLIRNQRAEMNAKGTHFFSDDELPMLPEWVEQMDQLDDMREQQKTTPATDSDG